MYEIRGKGITQIVLKDQVEALTKEGWRVTGMYQETVTQLNYVDVPDPTQGYSGATTSLQRYTPSSITYFILMLDEDSSLAHMNNTIESQKTDLTELKKYCEEKDKNIKDLEKKKDVYKEGRAHYEERYNKEMKKYANTLTIKNNMETDIGKIEKVIGSQKMKEILEND